jgi:hypothetical protein
MRKIFIISTVISLFVIGYFFLIQSEQKSEKPENQKAVQALAPLIIENVNVISQSQTVVMPKALDDCHPFERASHKLLLSWEKPLVQKLDALVAQGADPFELALGYQHSVNRLAAQPWLIKTLKSNAIQTNKRLKEEKELNRKLKENIPTIAQSIDQDQNKALKFLNSISITIPVPRKEFLSFPKISETEKVAILQNLQPTSDDIAGLMLQSERFPEIEIINLMAHVDDLSSYLTSSNTQHFLYLTEVAAFKAYAKVFDNLIIEGVPLADHNQLPNALEYALAGLTKEKKLSAVAEIIRTLEPYNLPVNISQRNHEKFSGRLIYEHFSLNKEIIDDLKNLYDIDIFTFASKGELPQPSEETTAILHESKNQHYIDEGVDLNTLVAANHCKTMRSDYDNRWPKINHEDIFNQVQKSFGSDIDSAYPTLRAYDSSLVDCYRFKNNAHNIDIRFYDHSKLPPAIKFIYRSQYKEALESFDVSAMNEIEKSIVFWAVFNRSPQNIAPFIKKGFVPRATDFQPVARLSIEKIQSLLDLGFQFDGTDKNGKTLVSLLANRKHHKHIHLFNDLGYPYNSDSYGKDPLDVILGSPNWNGVKENENIVRTINALMLFNPIIRDTHRSRMAEIKITQPKLYQSIIKENPQFAVDDNVEPNRFNCGINI